MSKFRQLSKFAQAREPGSLTPHFKLGFTFCKAEAGDVLLTLPFKRHWGFILFTTILLTVLAVPLVIVGASMISSLDGSLFTLLFNLFSLFWMLGWSVAVMIVGLLLSLLIIGRETLHAKADVLSLRIGVPGLGFGADFQALAVRGFRFRQADESTGSQWRGDHLCFDYVGESIGFGSAIAAEQGRQIIGWLQALYPPQRTPQHKMDAADPNVLPSLPVSDKLKTPFTRMISSTMTSSKMNSARINSARINSTKVDALPESTQGIAGIQGSVSLVSPSTVLLILANLIPVAGVLILDWSIAEVMILFWAESGIIGFYNLLKMWKVGGVAVLAMGPFFVAHFGGFMAVHLLFIYGIFVDGIATQPITETTTSAEMLRDMWVLAPALAGYFISHGVSYFINFIGKREYQGRSISQQMGEPYKRIVIMHVTIILGGFLVMALNSTMAVLLLLIAIKLASDIRSHLKEHQSHLTTESGNT